MPLICARLVFFCSLFGLAACMDTGTVTRAGTSPFWFQASAPQAVRLGSGEVIVHGPQGFCIDPSSVRNDRGGSFVILGSCASLANSGQAGRPRHLAMLSISIAEPSGASIASASEALVPYFGAANGRATLSRNGNPDSVQVLSVFTDEGAVIVNAIDQSLMPQGELSPEYWRGFFDIKGRVVTASVFSLNDKPLSAGTGQALLLELIAALRAANLGPETAQPPSEA